ncbi:DUF7261 family protein [Natrononativus amylolyticus]|uniref:DUF7261 family protein n=1 Tax=Natrononativus amylolyticus TaxID=2963434 RepID=UPI0020CEACCB|nr:hypothetical protein [Natrononativus amylolyticus]
MVSGRSRDRGQLILVSAIAIAFIILGVVVVFNGLLYTQTVSSSGTSGETAHASTVELEIKQGIGCFVHEAEDLEDTDEEMEEIKAFAELYHQSVSDSRSAVVDIPQEEISINNNEDSVDLTYIYESTDVSVEKTIEGISGGDCPNKGES